MAIVGTDQDDDELNKPTSSSSPNARAATAAAQGIPYGGAGGSFIGGTGTGSGQGATTGVAQPEAPQSYANLSQYLSANQTTGGTTGQAAENVVQQAGNMAKQAQGVYNTDASKDISDATTPIGVNQDTLSTIKSGTANVDQGMLDKIKAGGYTYSPTKIDDYGAADKSVLEGQVASGKAATGAYTGPTDFSTVGYGGPSYDKTVVSYGGPTTTSAFTGQTAADQADAIRQAGLVAGQVKNAQGGQAGVSALLKNAYQQPSYSSGENSLDAFLAGGTAGGQQALAQAPGVGQDIDNSYAGINAALTGKIGDAQKLADTTNATYKGAIDTATKTSGETKDKYGSSVQSAKDKAVADQAVAQGAGKKAQDELDRRSAAEAEALKLKQGVLDGQKPFSGIVDAAKKAGGDVADFIKNAPEKLASIPKSIISNISSGALGTQPDVQVRNDSALSKINTAVQNPLNNVFNKSTAAAIKAKNELEKIKAAAETKRLADEATTKAKQAATDVANRAKATVSNLKKGKIHFAHGGEIPSYSKILDMLKRK